MPDIIERNAKAARQLLECAAEIERLRAALKSITEIENEQYGGDWDEIERARNIAFAALADGRQPPVCANGQSAK